MPKPYKQKETYNFVAEAPTYYYSGNAAIPLNDMTSFQKMRIVKKGITKTYLVAFKTKTGLDYDQLAFALAVTRATLINKKGDDLFSDQISERIVALADLYSYGYEVFGAEESFNQWIFSKNMALGGIAPFSIIDNQYGREEVRNLLGRIEYGVYS